MKVGVLFPSRFEDPGEFLADARAMEAAGVDSVWLDESVGGIDPLLALAAIAAVTTDLRLGLVQGAAVDQRRTDTLQQLSRSRFISIPPGGRGGQGVSENWLHVTPPLDRESWAATLAQAENKADGVLVPMDPRLLDILRHPDDAIDRSDLILAQGQPIDIRVLAFDVFGTVVDWRGGVASELAAIAQRRHLSVDGSALAEAWRKRARTLLDQVSRGQMPWRVLDEMHRSALDDIVGDFSLEGLSAEDRQRLVQAWHHLPGWPDAVSGLSRLRERHVLTTLSNGGMAHLIDVIRSARLPFDCILSTELLKTYKPDPRAYQLVPTLLRVQPDQVLMVASHMYDLSAAADQGFRTAFVRRPQEWSGAKSEVPDSTVDIVADDFLDLATRLDSH